MASSERRLQVIQAGYGGTTADVAVLNGARSDSDPAVRSAALSGLSRCGMLSPEAILLGLGDQSPVVRQRTAQLVQRVDRATQTLEVTKALSLLLRDSTPLCVIAASETIGALGLTENVPILCEIATTHSDPLVVEEAVATLAELGDPAGLPIILSKESSKPALRRRVVAALGAFDGPEVEAALDRLSNDRDWQVRQAVAMLRRESFDETPYLTED